MSRRVAAACCLLLLLFALSFTGCAKTETPADPQNSSGTNGQTDSNDDAQQKARDAEVQTALDQLLAKQPLPSDLIAFLEEQIAAVSPAMASKLYLTLEENQLDYHWVLEDKYYADMSVQEMMFQEFIKTEKLESLYTMENSKVKALMEDTRNNGFRVETTEGVFMPVLDYQKHLQYQQYVEADLKDYIQLRFVESSQIAAKDASLMISWEQVLERALSQEAFLKAYPDSLKWKDVRRLLSNYEFFLLFGVDNTPLFSYQNGIMDPQVKSIYEKTIADPKNKDSQIVTMLSDYRKLLEASGWKVSPQVEQFRTARLTQANQESESDAGAQ